MGEAFLAFEAHIDEVGVGVAEVLVGESEGVGHALRAGPLDADVPEHLAGEGVHPRDGLGVVAEAHQRHLGVRGVHPPAGLGRLGRVLGETRPTRPAAVHGVGDGLELLLPGAVGRDGDGADTGERAGGVRGVGGGEDESGIGVGDRRGVGRRSDGRDRGQLGTEILGHGTGFGSHRDDLGAEPEGAQRVEDGGVGHDDAFDVGLTRIRRGGCEAGLRVITVGRDDVHLRHPCRHGGDGGAVRSRQRFLARTGGQRDHGQPDRGRQANASDE